jgi:N-acetyl-anhydromuramyl-L-alanine amidase AmpD
MGFNRGNNVHTYKRVGAHYIVTADGQIAQLYDDLDHVNASHGLNSRSVAIELAGNFPDARFNWWPPKPKVPIGHAPSPYVPDRCYLTPAQIRAGRCLLATLKARIPGINYIYAHHQSTNKTFDPGPDAWFNIAEWALITLNLTDRSQTSFGTGQAIPKSWRTSRPAMIQTNILNL